MTVKKQKKINFVNDCEAIVDYKELENAILWYSDSPVTSVKHIYMHGKYPAVSIGKDKIHIHRLLMMYWLDSKIPTEFSVHHIDENRLNASKNNLSVVLNSVHNSNHNKGKKITPKMRDRLLAMNHARKGTRQPFHRKDVSINDVKELLDKGYSINKIAKELDCDWSTVKAREKDIFDNADLLEVDYMKYKVGDKVRVKSWDKMVEEYGMYNGSIMSGDVFFIKGMRKFCGEILEVVKVRYDTYEVAGENDAGRFVWTDEMFEDISDDELAEELWGELTVPSNNVNHPSHYNDGNIEVIDYIEDKKLGFHLGNAIKYISRAGKKDKAKTREDIEKAIWYLKRYLEVE